MLEMAGCGGESILKSQMSWRESWALLEEIGTTGHPKNCLVLV